MAEADGPQRQKTWLLAGLSGSLMGAAVGFAAGQSWPPSPVPPPPPCPTVQPPTVPLSPAMPRPPAPPACPDVQAELDALQAELRFARAQVASLGGAFASWPDSPPHGYAAAAVTTWMNQHFDPALGELEMVACDEFPCIAAVRLPAASPASSALVQPLVDRFAADHDQAQPRVHMVGRQDAAWGLVVLGPDLQAHDDAATRLPQRLEELAEVVADTP